MYTQLLRVPHESEFDRWCLRKIVPGKTDVQHRASTLQDRKLEHRIPSRKHCLTPAINACLQLGYCFTILSRHAPKRVTTWRVHGRGGELRVVETKESFRWKNSRQKKVFPGDWALRNLSSGGGSAVLGLKNSRQRNSIRAKTRPL